MTEESADWLVLQSLKEILPAVEAYLMSGDAHAKFAKQRVWRKPVERAKAAIAKKDGAPR